mgnify:CR=1 FL=1
MKNIKLKLLEIIQNTCHKVSEWAWRKRIMLMHEKK